MFNRSDNYSRRDDRDDGGSWRNWIPEWMGGNKDRDDRDYHYARTTTYRDGDRDRDYTSSYNRGGTGYGGQDYNVSRTYVRDSDTRGTGYGGGLSSDAGTRGGYGYQTSGQAYGGGFSSDRDNRGWSSSYDRDHPQTYVRSETTRTYNDRDRDTYGGSGSQYRPTGGDAYARGTYTSGGQYGGSSSWDRPTGGYGGDYSSRTYGGTTGGSYGRDNDRGYSYTSRTNW